MEPRCYLDHNATAPLVAAAREAALAWLDGANASSVHAEGRAARRMVEESRGEIAARLGACGGTLVFASGASEAAALVLTPDYRDARAPLRFDRLLVGATEHPCVLGGGRFAPDRVERLPVDGNGLIELDALDAALGRGGAPMVAVMLANNETGVIAPVAEIASRVAAAGGYLVVDATQAVGRVAVSLDALGADALVLSSHKIGGPMGAGALLLRPGAPVPVPLAEAGGQENGLRGGTENVAAVAGFAAALRAVGDLGPMGAVRARRDRFESELARVAPTATAHAAGAPRLPNTSLFSFAAIPAETAQIAFDLDGVSVSTGSACASGKVGSSHVLAAMGVAARGAVRLSIGRETTDDEIDRALRSVARLGARDLEKQDLARAA